MNHILAAVLVAALALTGTGARPAVATQRAATVSITA